MIEPGQTVHVPVRVEIPEADNVSELCRELSNLTKGLGIGAATYGVRFMIEENLESQLSVKIRINLDVDRLRALDGGAISP